jgi:hypothetical protein
MIPMVEGTRDQLIKKPLNQMYHTSEYAEEREKIAESRKMYEIVWGVPNYDSMNAEEKQVAIKDFTDEVRERIETYNNLIVRLPVDTYHNKVASRHIFLDWKEYVDHSLQWLVDKGALMTTPHTGRSTDGIDYDYTEYYTVEDGKYVPLIDYSYCQDEDGNIIHDRWDYWREWDFLRLDKVLNFAQQ